MTMTTPETARRVPGRRAPERRARPHRLRRRRRRHAQPRATATARRDHGHRGHDGHDRRHPQRQGRQRHDRGPRRPRSGSPRSATRPCRSSTSAGSRSASPTESDSDVARLPEDQQATYASATILAASADEVDLEKLASLKPDLILVQMPDDRVREDREAAGGDRPDRVLRARHRVEGPRRRTRGGRQHDGCAERAEGGVRGAASPGSRRRTARSSTTPRSSTSTARRSSDPGTFAIADIGCSEIARDEVGMDFPKAADGEDPLAYDVLVVRAAR